MYKLSNLSIIQSLTSRGVFLSKKFNKKNHKNTLVYLRSPKHFNIGKHKIFSYKNKFMDLLDLNHKVTTKTLIKYEQYFFKLMYKLKHTHSLKHTNSLRVNLKTKII